VNDHDIRDDAAIVALAGALKKVAVLGIKTSAQADQPGYYVPEYLVGAGVEVVPVPVYYPEATEILGKPVVRDLKAAGPVDAVIVFRRSSDVAHHVDDLIALAPKAVWMQQGIRSEDAAARLTAAGIDVVQDRCVMVDHKRAKQR
jgi:predicted CoA-binding protein